MTQRILLLGAAGQLGQALVPQLAALGSLTALTRSECDLSRAEQIRMVVRTLRPHVIVNSAAYTAVDLAESEPELAARVNAAAPAVLAEEARRLDAVLVHYSTDYVFRGNRRGRYRETDPPDPVNVYGATKLAGEAAVRTHERHLILRTSWLFSPRPRNFLSTMLELAAGRDALEVVADQHGTPTSATCVATATVHMLTKLLVRDGSFGTYHVACSGTASRHEYARFIVAEAWRAGARLRCRPEDVRAIIGTARRDPAARPANSSLDNRQAMTAFDLHLPCWHQEVRAAVRAWLMQRGGWAT